MSVRETAQTTGLTETHVKVMVFRARAALLKGVKLA
jgi:DNA-directed RNA polymerase specialized sigma24 family protein